MGTVVLISLGAVFGALSRWGLGVLLNPILGAFSFGTLAANWLGCFFIGIAMALSLSDSTKLWLITGFLGSFTTFSAFSAEISEKLIQGKWISALSVFSLHTLGGFAFTLLAFYWVKK
jgi:CrcB protein